jgi:hypothetical protein
MGTHHDKQFPGEDDLTEAPATHCWPPKKSCA